MEYEMEYTPKSQTSYRGTVELHDGTHHHINPITARYGDNGTVKYVVLTDKAEDNTLYLQGNMVEELYKLWKQKLGDFGASKVYIEKQQEEENEALHDVKLTTRQLEVLHKLLEPEQTRWR